MFVSEKIGLVAPPTPDELDSESTESSEPSDRIVFVGWTEEGLTAAGAGAMGLAACGLVLLALATTSGLTRLLLAVSEPRSTLRKKPSLKNGYFYFIFYLQTNFYQKIIK